MSVTHRTAPVGLGVPAETTMSGSLEKVKKHGQQSLSSSFKKKLLSGLGKFRGLKGGYKDKPFVASKCVSGPLGLHEDQELCGAGDTSLPPSASCSGANPSLDALLRLCQRQSNTNRGFVGTVPIVSVKDLDRALYGGPHAVLVLQIGDDAADTDPTAASIKHCSSELPQAVQQRVAQHQNCATASLLRAPHTNALPLSFTRAVCMARWMPPEEFSTAVPGSDGGNGGGEAAGYSASHLCVSGAATSTATVGVPPVSALATGIVSVTADGGSAASSEPQPSLTVPYSFNNLKSPVESLTRDSLPCGEIESCSVTSCGDEIAAVASIVAASTANDTSTFPGTGGTIMPVESTVRPRPLPATACFAATTHPLPWCTMLPSSSTRASATAVLDALETSGADTAIVGEFGDEALLQEPATCQSHPPQHPQLNPQSNMHHQYLPPSLGKATGCLARELHAYGSGGRGSESATAAVGSWPHTFPRHNCVASSMMATFEREGSIAKTANAQQPLCSNDLPSASSISRCLAAAAVASTSGSATGFQSADPCVLPISPFGSGLPIGAIAEAARRSTAAGTALGSCVPTVSAAAAVTVAAVSAAGGGGGGGRVPWSRSAASTLPGTYGSYAKAAASADLAESSVSHLGSNAAGAMEASAEGAKDLRASRPPVPHDVGIPPAPASLANPSNTEEERRTGCAVGGETGLEPMFVSRAMDAVMGSAHADVLRCVLCALISNHPSLQLILEDIIRNAIVGRVVQHEQLLACPRLTTPIQPQPTMMVTTMQQLLSSTLQAPAGAPTQSAAASTGFNAAAWIRDSMNGSSGTAPSYPTSVRSSNPESQLQQQQSASRLSPAAMQQYQQQRQSHSRRDCNPLDHFLLLRFTACYLDHQGSGSSVGGTTAPPQLTPQPISPALPALFVSFSRPYAVAVAASEAAATAAMASYGGSSNSATVSGTSQDLAAAVSTATPSTLAAAAGARHLTPQPQYPSSPSIRGDTPFGLVSGAGGVVGARSEIGKSPSLGSLFGSLGKGSWLRPGGNGLAAMNSASPGPSPKVAPLTASTKYIVSSSSGTGDNATNSVRLVSELEGQALCGGLSAPPCPPPAAGAMGIDVLCSHLRRELLLSAHVPVAMTVVSLDGRVLYQNGRSVACFGNAVGLQAAAGTNVSYSDHSLQRIFAYDPPALESMLEAVRGGKTWSGLVSMPPHLDLSQPDSGAVGPPSGALSTELVCSGILPATQSEGGNSSHPAAAATAAAAGIAPDDASPNVRCTLTQKLQFQSNSNDRCLGLGTLSSSAAPPSVAAVSGQALLTVVGGNGSCGTAVGLGWTACMPSPAAAGGSSNAVRNLDSPQPDADRGLASPVGASADWARSFSSYSASVGRPITNLPRNISAPTFWAVAGSGCPLPSVLEVETCSGGGNAEPFPARTSWNAYHAFSPVTSTLLFSSSPLTGVGPLSKLASVSGAGAIACSGSSFVGPTTAGLAQSSHVAQHLSGSRRARIHRSRSLAQTEYALGASNRAMRLASSSAVSQGLPGASSRPGATGIHGGWSYGSAEGLQMCGSVGADVPPALRDAGSSSSGSGNVTATVAADIGVLSSAASALNGAKMKAESPGTERTRATDALRVSTACGGGREVAGGSGRQLLPSPVGEPSSTSFRVPLPATHSRNGSYGGATAAAQAAHACTPQYIGACCWHEIQADLVLDPVTAEWNLVLVCHDVTPYVQAELEVRQVLDAEHRILEEVFPRHVLEVMTLDKRRESAFGFASGGGGVGSCPAFASVTSLQSPMSYNGHGVQRPWSGGGGRRAVAVSFGGAGAGAATSVAAALGRTSAQALRVVPGPSLAAAPAAYQNGSGSVAGITGHAEHADSNRLANVSQTAALPSTGGSGTLSRRSESSMPHTPMQAVASSAGNGNCGGGGERRSISTHLGVSCSLASYNYSNCTTAGAYDSFDDHTSYGCFSPHLHHGGGEEVVPTSLYTTSAAATAADASSPASIQTQHSTVTQSSRRPPSHTLQLLGEDASTALGRCSFSHDAVSLSVHSDNLHNGASSAVATMSGSQQYMARSHEEVTVLFADIASFTDMCGQVPPHHVMAFLNDLFTVFDQLVEKHQVYKVETIGDCYMVCGGLVEEDSEGFRSVTETVDPFHSHKVFAFAADMVAAARGMVMPGTVVPVQLRVGIHSGPVMSGIVGRKMPRFCLFGDTVNVASRMESTGVPGAIHISASTQALLGDVANGFLPTGGIKVKGKGFMFTYLYDPTGIAAQQLAVKRSQEVSRTDSDIHQVTTALAHSIAASATATAPTDLPDALATPQHLQTTNVDGIAMENIPCF